MRNIWAKVCIPYRGMTPWVSSFCEHGCIPLRRGDVRQRLEENKTKGIESRVPGYSIRYINVYIYIHMTYLHLFK